MFDFQDKKNRYKMTAAALFTAAAMCVGGSGDQRRRILNWISRRPWFPTDFWKKRTMKKIRLKERQG